jgi:hypothetical protein
MCLLFISISSTQNLIIRIILVRCSLNRAHHKDYSCSPSQYYSIMLAVVSCIHIKSSIYSPKCRCRHTHNIEPQEYYRILIIQVVAQFLLSRYGNSHSRKSVLFVCCLRFFLSFSLRGITYDSAYYFSF